MNWFFKKELDKISKPKCPECNSVNLYANFDCHTWKGRGGVWMTCMGCDSAISYTCEDCSWMYFHGMNPRNPKKQAEDKKRPCWVDDEWLYVKFGPSKHPDIEWIWESD